MLARSTPSISTKTAIVPLELVTVQAGPGECHPDGVGPGVSQRLATPPDTDVVIPGVKGLLLKLVDPVAPAVMSPILTTLGVHETSGFQGEVVGKLAEGDM